MKKIINFRWGILLLSFLIVSCSGSSPDEGSTDLPKNLELSIDIQGETSANPNGDGSGKVTLHFSADNATKYKLNFGNGETVETSAKTYSYTYTGSGTKTYDIYVSAYKANKFISQSETITIYVAPGLIWSDEFDYNGAPDPSKWGYDLGGGGWGNNEAEYYTNRTENAVVENGVLKITAQKEDYEGASYTSARLNTKGKFNFKYGKIEVRAKLPEGGGTWPAIWMLGSNVETAGWPACGEIDIMEEVGNDPGRIHSSLHTPSSHGATTNTATKIVPDFSTEFHVYSAEWSANKIQFAVDGTVFYTYNPAEKNASTWPFDSNQFIILNLAMGGNFGGDIDPEFTTGTMEVDYVRVYQ